MTEDNEKKRKIAAGSVKLQMAGDLLMAKPDRNDLSLFNKYQALIEKFANLSREERHIDYKFLLALILTGHAKKTQSQEERKKLFDLKNQLFFSVANHFESRKKVAFRYLASKNFRVTKFCKACEERNTKEDLARHLWKFCKDCEVDRKFYNVLSMHHKFPEGSATIFLSNDLIHQVKGIRVNSKGKLEDYEEDITFGKYVYNPKNLAIFDIESTFAAQKKLLSLGK